MKIKKLLIKSIEMLINKQSLYFYNFKRIYDKMQAVII